MSTIDLNCDLGESFGRWSLGDDEAMLDLVSSANVACGFHAGDPSVMRRTVAAAVARGVTVGAHPGYADLRGFGRSAMDVPAASLRDDILYQLGALAAICRGEGAVIAHAKPHGALYNTMAGDDAVARAVASAVTALDARLRVFVPAGSQAETLVRAEGLRPVREAFIDRAYLSDGRLSPREQPGSVIDDPEKAAERAVRLAADGTVEALDGTVLELAPETLCLHGDTPGAVRIAERVRAALDAAGIRVESLG